ncbi:signal transduction histidine kinase LytS [Formosa agariphila KMM 3901]|uniref:Signal transduction histidine kinase LytS n=1 Tax=Formosa agariphila (strain DSM 15362 / KCTC 12365 / LMG 23005 / KMM 3901 / M-2Alg 35-1) TaxID=1347342 RepID=T2KQN1_FORAG|nr:signal transduction histidine kinase LytS [Formosa agariphila KMM 3901]
MRKRYWSYLFWLIFMLAMVYLVRTGLNYVLVTKNIWPEAGSSGQFLELNHIVAVVLGELYVIGFVSAIKLLIDWSIEKQRNEALAKLQLSTELKYLRTQIQPHFFFNTLNNLYALTLSKSDNAPQLVIKISDMMQYVLYEVNSSKADLFEEINHINNFIDIARLRFNDSIEFETDITGNIEDVEVPPLLFLTFIENSFKHGLKNSDKVTVAMSFEVKGKDYLEFNLVNSFNSNSDITNEQGIGIANTKRRLNLLFGSNYVLETTIRDNTYNLFLKIPIR